MMNLGEQNYPTISRIQRKNQAQNDLQMAYKKLNVFIENINKKIQDRLQLVQQICLQEYKQQMKIMSEQLSNIRNVLDTEILKQRSNERLFYLEEERDFFRGQVMKLSEQLNILTKNNQKLKHQLDEKVEQSNNYKQIVTVLQNKIIRIQNEALEMEKIKNQSIVYQKYQNQSKSLAPTQTGFTNFNSNQQSKNIPEQQNSQFTKMRSMSLRTFKDKKFTIRTLKNPQTSTKQEILEDCIKQIKKKIFYRTLNSKQSPKIHFNEQNKIPFSKFTKTDKQDLITRILSNNKILQTFYQFLIKDSEECESTLMRKSIRNHNWKHNSEQLSQAKIEFNKKIYELKCLNR